LAAILLTGAATPNHPNQNMGITPLRAAMFAIRLLKSQAVDANRANKSLIRPNIFTGTIFGQNTLETLGNGYIL
jgi:hypothetical protein